MLEMGETDTAPRKPVPEGYLPGCRAGHQQKEPAMHPDFDMNNKTPDRSLFADNNKSGLDDFNKVAPRNDWDNNKLDGPGEEPAFAFKPKAPPPPSGGSGGAAAVALPEPEQQTVTAVAYQVRPGYGRR
jgi:hypothetical protein